jgi:hypothetical protein
LANLESSEDKFEIQLRPLDKKRERQLLQVHRQALLDQLVAETNPATAFHLTVILLFLKKRNAVLHAPGKSIATVLANLKPDLPAPVFTQLSTYQSKVIKFLTGDKEIEASLQQDLPPLKELVLGKEEPSGAETKGSSRKGKEIQE